MQCETANGYRYWCTQILWSYPGTSVTLYIIRTDLYASLPQYQSSIRNVSSASKRSTTTEVGRSPFTTNVPKIICRFESYGMKMLKGCSCFLKKVLIPLNSQNTELLLLYIRSWERNKGVRSVSVKREFSVTAHMQTNLFLPKLFQETFTFVTFPALARDVRASLFDGWPKWHMWKQMTN